MLKINSDLFSRIKTKLETDKNKYSKIKLEISKIFFGLMSSIYFFSYISIVAGYNPEQFGKFIYRIYPVFVFSIFALIFDVIIYGTNIYSKGKASLVKIPLFIILLVIYIFLLAINFGLKLN